VRAALVGLTLAGCPLSDPYFIDPTLGQGGAPGGPRPGAGAPNGGPKPNDMIAKGGSGSTCVPAPEVCDGVSNDCDAEIDEDDVCPSGCSAHQRNGHLYLLCVAPTATGNVDYNFATMRCQNARNELDLSVGLQLAIVESDDEETFLKNWIASTAPATTLVWLGANDIAQEGTWVWGQGAAAWSFLKVGPMGDATPMPGKFADFAPGTPDGTAQMDEDCAAFDGSEAWQWNDEPCAGRIPGYLCEQSP
jgi:hypothetical protein